MLSILGVKIDNLTINQTLNKIEGFLIDGKQHYIITPNPEFLVRAQCDPEFKEILNQADLAVADGIGLILVSWFLGQPLKERIAGVDLMEKICQQAAVKNWPVFLLGGREGVAEKAIEKLKRKYQGLKAEVKSEITLKARSQKQSPSGILFVALGAPSQEKWIKNNLRKMPQIKVAMGVGGSFDFISGRIKRAPKIIRQIGLEWLWRFCCQPWRVKRIYRAVIIFPWLVIKEKFKKA